MTSMRTWDPAVGFGPAISMIRIPRQSEGYWTKPLDPSATVGKLKRILR